MDTEPRHNLVEPEGVNAGSAKSTAEDDDPQPDARPGGKPEHSDEPGPHNDQIVDAPFMPRDPDAPSLPQSTEEGAR